MVIWEMCYSSRLSQGQHCQVDAHLFSLTALPFPTLYSQVPTAGSTRVSNGLARAHLGLDNTALISPETKKWKKKRACEDGTQYFFCCFNNWSWSEKVFSGCLLFWKVARHQAEGNEASIILMTETARKLPFTEPFKKKILSQTLSSFFFYFSSPFLCKG